MTVDTHDPETHPLPFAGLRCPHCDYDLTGLPRTRCPECGNEFDLILLEQIRDDVERPATPWDTDRNIGGFVRTWVMAMRNPRRLAREFPSRYSVRRAWAYSGLCYGIAGTLLLACSLPGDIRFIRDVFSIVAGSTIAFVLTEIMIASWLALLLKPTFVRKRYRLWRGLAHYTSGFTILSALAGSVFALPKSTGVMYTGRADLYMAVFWSLATVSFLWWITSLSAMIIERSGPGLRLPIACVGVIVIGFAGIFIGYLATAFTLISLMGLFPKL